MKRLIAVLAMLLLSSVGAVRAANSDYPESKMVNNVRITRDLVVLGATTLTGATTQTGNLTIAGNLTVTGAVTHSSTLTQTGTATFTVAPVLTSATLSANDDTITIQNLGNANIVQSEGAQTVNGVKTFGSAPVVPDASFTRAKLATEAAAAYPIDLQAQIRTITGLTLDATGGAALYKVVAGAFGTGTLELRGDDANANTITSTGSLVFQLPPEYVAGSAVTIRLNSHTTGAGTITARTVDCETFKMGTDGTAGADLVTTAAQTITGTSAAYNFTVTPTGLVAGDELRINIRNVLTITDATATRSHLTNARVLIDIKG